MGHDMMEEVQEHADSLKQRLTNIWQALDEGMSISEDGEVVEDDAEYAQHPMEHLDESILEIRHEVGTTFGVVFSTGGPHVEIEWDFRAGGPVVVAHWSSATAYARGEAIERTADYFREMVEVE